MEERAVGDGDIGIALTRLNKLQAIEADRITSIAPGVPDATSRPEPGKFFNGVKTDNYGRPVAYSICRRLYDSLEFERVLPAATLVMHAYTTRFDQLRGITPLAPAINTFSDAYEACWYSLQKMKQSASYGLVIKREDGGEDLGTDTASGYGMTYRVDHSSLIWGRMTPLSGLRPARRQQSSTGSTRRLSGWP